MKAVIFLSICLLNFSVKTSKGGGIISFKLESFRNPDQRDINRKCCDADKNANTCTASSCDTYFVTCLSSTNLTKRCDYGELWMDEVNNGNFGSRIAIPESSGQFHKNPYQIPFERWNGSFSFKIEVVDDDNGANRLNHDDNDKIDYLFAVLSTKAGQNSSIATNHSFNLNGINVELKMSAKVWCDKYYFIPDCKEYCKDRNDSTGHFKCNYEKGMKECFKGWYGENCVLHCLPRDDIFGHYKCNETDGQKICLDGWYDPDTNCTKENKKNNASISVNTTDIKISPTISITASKHQSKVAVKHSIPSLDKVDFSQKPNQLSPTNKGSFDSNILVYFGGLILFTILLLSALVGIWKFVPKFKRKRAVAPEGNWQNVRRKRTISTKTGMPPIPSTKISFQVTHLGNNNTENMQRLRNGSKRSVIQVKSLNTAPDNKKFGANPDNSGRRKVTFGGSSYSVV